MKSDAVIPCLLWCGDYLCDLNNWREPETNGVWELCVMTWVMCCNGESYIKRGMSRGQEQHFLRLFDRLSNLVSATQGVSQSGKVYICGRLHHLAELLTGGRRA